MRVVLDANIYVSAAIGVGPAHRIVQAALSATGIDVCLCPMLLTEIGDVLARPRLRKRISAEASEVFVDDLVMLLDFVPDPSRVRAATRDPKDDYIVALAREQGADFIVTGDKGLLEWEEQRPPVVTPATLRVCGPTRHRRLRRRQLQPFRTLPARVKGCNPASDTFRIIPGQSVSDPGVSDAGFSALVVSIGP